jgi:hypothetical protein
VYHKTSIFCVNKVILRSVALTLEEVAALQGNIDDNALGKAIDLVESAIRLTAGV